MKKYRLILTAAAVFAVVGSAFAFTTGKYFCKSTSGGTCSTNKEYNDYVSGPGRLDYYCGTSANACANATTTIPVIDIQ